jgi:hypothetical protein
VVATQEGRNPPLQTLHVVEAFDVRWGQREGSVGAHPAPESPKPWSQITSAGEEEDIVTDALLSLREVVRTALEWQRLGRKRAKEGVNRATAVHINQILRHIGSRMAKSGLRPHLVGVGAGVVLCHLMHLVLRRPGPRCNLTWARWRDSDGRSSWSSWSSQPSPSSERGVER